MEVYVDDLLVKSKEPERHVADLGETFAVLRHYRMKLNLLNCAFDVESGKFLGFLVSKQGIEANSKNVEAILGMPLTRNINEVQRLAG